MKRIVLIDGNSLLYKTYFATAYGSGDIMRSLDGTPTNAVFGFINVIHKIVESEPDYVFVAFDAGKKTFRHLEYGEYKGGRKPTPEELKIQFPIIKNYLDASNIYHFEIENYEADDILATLAKKYSSDYKVEVYSSDRDMLQVINDNTVVCLTKVGVSDVTVMNKEALFEKYQITPSQIPDLKGLMGDSSDNIPGIAGIGEKTAIKLLSTYGTLENIIENVDEIKGALHDKIVNGKEMGLLSKKIATSYFDVALPFGLDDIRFKEEDVAKVTSFYEKYNMNSFLKKQKKRVNIEFNYSVVDTLDVSMYDKELAIVVHLDDDNYHFANVLGFGISDGTSSYYLPFSSALSDTKFIEYIQSDKVKIGYDIKRFINSLVKYDIRVDGFVYDCAIATYLINPALVKDEYKCFSYYDVFLPVLDKNSSVEDRQKYYSMQAYSLFKLKDESLSKMKENEQEKLFYDIEMPLVFVLAHMEKNGVKLDTKFLDELGNRYKEKVKGIENEIYNLVGYKFNVASPKQVGELLYDKLGFPSNKKRSTAEDVLEKFKMMHPVVPLILEYRKYAKLVSTYIDGLKPYVYSDGLVHTIYNQTLTLTGRLSSSAPNLQNISIRDEEGREVRKAFVTKDSDSCFLSLDYSQIELRVLASIASDANMIDDFINGVDVHTSTAMKVFNKSKDEVTSDDRRNAKAINFGIVYGISDWGLSEQIGLPPSQAKIFIAKYFEHYPGIKSYLDNVVTDAINTGYVTTLLNRKRYIDELKSSTYMIREFGKRVAMNTPIQGSAADIIKIAMINVRKMLKNNKFKTKMILQIHDELIFEVPKDELTTIIPLIKNEMESALKLKVPLKVEYGYGSNLYDTK